MNNDNGCENLEQAGSPISGQHHSFDMALAVEYGVECAILIHHFQHWIRFNRARKPHMIRDGRCWTAQSRKDIEAHFPYWSFEEVKYLCEKLISMKVLMTGVFNKKPTDRTLWYAFVDEKKFKVDDDFQILFTKRENSPLQKGKFPIVNKDKDSKKKIEESVSSPPAPDTDIADFFFDTLQKINPKVCEPNRNLWAKQMALIRNVDGRTEQEIVAVINYIADQHSNPKRDFTWSKAVMSPLKLRKHFAAIWLEMRTTTPEQTKQAADEEKKERIEENKEWAVKAKQSANSQLKEKFQVRFVVRDNAVELENKRIPNSLMIIGYAELGFKEIVTNSLSKWQIFL